MCILYIVTIEIVHCRTYLKWLWIARKGGLEQAQQPKWAKMLSESHFDDDDSDHSDSGDGLGIKVTWKSLGYLIEYALHIYTSV